MENVSEFRIFDPTEPFIILTEILFPDIISGNLSALNECTVLKKRIDLFQKNYSGSNFAWA